MNGKTHMVVGIACASVLYPASIPAMLAGALGGLLPDIDHPNSKIGRRLLPASWTIRAVFGHRTITHGMFFFSALTALSALAVQRGLLHFDLFICFVAGYALHIIADMLTPHGVPLFYPFPWRSRIPIIWRFSRLTESFCLVLSALIIAYALGGT